MTQPIPTDAATAVLRPDRPTATKVGARRALVLHDRPRVVTLIELALQHGHFDVRAARNLAEAEAILATWPPDMAVVDLDHDDSTTLLDRLGTSNTLAQSETPVLGLTRRRDLRTKLQAFELGVDDILTLPVSPEELLARSNVLTRQASWTQRPIISSIGLPDREADILNREFGVGQEIIHLNGIEASLLRVLASRPGQVVTPEQLVEAVWGPDFAREGKVVDRYSRSLQVKLGNADPDLCFIATVPGGYRMTPTVPTSGRDRDPELGDHLPPEQTSRPTRQTRPTLRATGDLTATLRSRERPFGSQ